MGLAEKSCRAYPPGTQPLDEKATARYLAELKTPWEVSQAGQLRREFVFKNFPAAIEFVNRVAELAEREDHHPMVHIFCEKTVIVLWTNSIGGLSENDFIMARKIELIADSRAA